MATMKSQNSHIFWGIPTGLLLFFVLCFNQADNVRLLCAGLMALTLGVLALRYSHLRARMHTPLIMLLLVTALGGISTAYALSGKFALQGFLYLMSALCTSILLLSVPDDRGRFAATAIAAAGAWISLFSIDHTATRLLSGRLLSFLSRFSEAYTNVSGIEQGARLTSIFEAPNVFAGCVGIGVLLSLGLAMTADDQTQRKTGLVLLYLNAMAFVMAFSMGATAAIAVGFLLYLVLERKERRGMLLVLMAETFVTVLLGVIPAATALEGWDGIRPIPLLSMAGGAALLCAVDHHWGRSLGEKLRFSGRKLGGILVALVVFVLAACSWTTGIKLEAGDSLRRAAYPEPGSYTISAEGGETVTVTIESQNREDAMMHTSIVLYTGALEGAAFTVPEDSIVVYFNFSAQADTELNAVTWQGGSVPLGYPLLPGFIANRLQGFFANQNVIQRLVFFSDGLKLFRESPLLGQGLGAFESALFRVQSFYYETKYVHNHYIQTLLETGIVGLILFLGLLGACAGCIFLARKGSEPHPLTPALGALLLYMSIHAGSDVVFSSGIYLPLAFGVFALINLCCGEAVPVPRRLRGASCAGACALLLVFLVLVGCNLRAGQIGRNATTMEELRAAEAMDPFEWTDYAISYVANAPAQGSPEILRQAEEYVQKLDGESSNSLHYYLARYCFETGQMERAMEMAQKQARATISSSRWWNTLFALIYEYDDGSAAYQAGVRALAEMMEQWNAENLGTIGLEENVQAFVDQVLSR